MPDYFLDLFDGPVLFAHGQPIQLAPAQQAVLSLAAVAGERGVSDNTLRLLMWQDDPPPATLKHRLSQVCYAINRRAGALLLSRQHGRCRVTPGLLATDLSELETSSLKGDFGRAVALLERGFLSRLDSGASDQLSDWISAKRLTLRNQLRGAALSHWSRCAAAGEWLTSLPAAAALLHMDPGDETALQRLLRSRAMSGGIQEGLAAFNEFRERCALIGQPWSPSQGTLQLLKRLESPRDTAMRGGWPSAPSHRDPPFVGRSSEVQSLISFLVADAPRGAEVFLLSAEAGMGKTRLIQEALAKAQPEGVLVGRCHELQREILLNPLLEAVSSDWVMAHIDELPEPWKATLLSLLPETQRRSDLLEEPPALRPGAIPRRLFEAFRQLLSSLSRDAPVVLILDDFHWLDDTSLAVLDYVWRRWQNGHLKILLAARPEELGMARGPSSWLDQLRVDRCLHELLIPELPEATLHELVSLVVPRPLPQLERERLTALSACNPYFLIELVAEWSNGRLPLGSLLPDPLFPIPISLRQLFERRLASLSPTAERCASLMAAKDDSVVPSELARLARVTNPRCLEALEELRRHRLVEMAGSGVKLRHDLVRQTIRGRFEPLWSGWVHSRVAQSLLTNRPGDVDRLALHFHRAGKPQEALHYSLRAAERAESAGAVPEAIGFYLLAQQNASDGDTLAVVAGRLGHLHFIHRRFQEAMPLLAFAAVRYRELGDAQMSLRLLVLYEDARGHHDGEEMTSVLTEVRDLATEASALGYHEVLAEALDVQIHLLDRMERPAEVYSVLEQAAAMLGSTSGAEGRSALNRVLSLHLYYGESSLALVAGRAAVLEARNAGRADHLLNALNRLIVVLLHLGLLDSEEGQRCLHEAEGLASNSGDLFLKYNVALNVGVWALDSGDLDRADAAFRRAGKIMPAEGDLMHFILLCNLGELRSAQRRYPEAEEIFQSAQDSWRPGMPQYLRGVVNAGLGLCALEGGRLTEAREIASQLGDPPKSWYFDPSVRATFRARLLDRLGHATQALRLLDGVCSNLEDRLVTAWIKLRLERHRIAWRRGYGCSLELQKTLGVTRSLGLKIREGELLEIMKRHE